MGKELNGARASERFWYMDILRIFATLGVVVLHATPFLQFEGITASSGIWKVLTAVSNPFRASVPLFFMLSGALLLDEKKKMTARSVYKKYVLRMVVSFVFWSAVYAFMVCLQTGKGKWTFVNQFFRGHYHMWFIFSITSLYMIVPFLRKITADRKLMGYFLLMGFVLIFLFSRVFGVLQLFSLPHEDVLQSVRAAYLQLNPFNSLYFVVYFVLGYALHTTRLGKRTRLAAYALGVAGLLANAMLDAWLTNRTGENSAYFHELTSLSVFYMAIAIFVFAKRSMEGVSLKDSAKKPLLLLSKCSFGVYLIHPMLIERIGIVFPDAPGLLLVGVPLYSLLIFGLSLAITVIISRIPLIRQTVL